MTISPFLIYLWGISENVSGTFGAIAIICACVLALTVVLIPVILIEVGEENAPKIWQGVKWLIGAAIISALLHTLIPDKKTIACMVIVPAIANSKAIQQDVPELYQMAVDALKETLKTKDAKP